MLYTSFGLKNASHLIWQYIDTNMSHETSVLRPRDPSQVNSDDWPEFELKQALVFDPEDPNRAPVSLLHAGHYRPLSITGKLEPPNSRNIGSWLNDSIHRSVHIELTDIKEFSYGEYGDGSLDIWAAGQAGWFTIKPSRAYRDMYSDMTQALKLLYFMADSYKALRKYADLSAPYFFQKVRDPKKNTSSCIDFWFQCSEAGLEGSEDVADVAEMFTKHRHFLIASMLTNKEGLQWYRVPLYTWFQVTFPVSQVTPLYKATANPSIRMTFFLSNQESNHRERNHHHKRAAHNPLPPRPQAREGRRPQQNNKARLRSLLSPYARVVLLDQPDRNRR